MTKPIPRKIIRNPRAGTLQTLTTPIAFLGLGLLIIEATLALVLTSSKLSEEHVWAGFLCMIGIFAFVLTVAVLFFWFRPQNLLFGKEEHAIPALAPSALRDSVEELIVANVKPEALKKHNLLIE